MHPVNACVSNVMRLCIKSCYNKAGVGNINSPPLFQRYSTLDAKSV